MAYLEIETGDGIRRVALERERLSIGRLSHNDVVLPFAQISRQHAELRRINGRWWIADLQSTNGLQLNSRRIQEHALTDGDRIMMAPGISLVFVADGDGESPRRRSMSPAAAPTAMPPSPPSPASLAAPDPIDPWAQSPGFRGARSAAGVPDFGAATSQRAEAEAGIGAAADYSFGVPSSYGGNGRSVPMAGGPQPGERDDYDPYRRESPAHERTYATAGPAGTLLHVCQTCGQLTAPDAVYCQSCHNSIAHECAKCYLSLLPIQDRCPRCHTPNRLSVRRAHPGRGLS